MHVFVGSRLSRSVPERRKGDWEREEMLARRRESGISRALVSSNRIAPLERS